MKAHIHLNLINKEELVSSSPVRTQAIAPFFIAVIAVCIFAWWLYLYTDYKSHKKVNNQHAELSRQIKPAYNKVLELTTQEQEFTALNAQITAYSHSRLEYSSVLSSIPDHVAPSIQFTMIKVLEPPVPLFADDKTSSGPTNISEKTEITITGRAAGTKVDAVDQLLKSLNSDSYTNLILSAFIPKGSVQQDSKSKNNMQEFLLFEIKCTCKPRRFQ